MPLRIEVFPDDKLTWRVDWLSDISYPNRHAMHRQPSMMVHLSALRQDGGKAYRTTFTRYVSIGTLVVLRIGETWKGKELLDSPQYTMEEWKLDIGPSTTSTIKAGLSVGGEFVLPLNEHPGHEGATRSFCVKVDLPKGRCIVIPALELIRFYFGSSSALLEHLFRPPLQRDNLFDKALKSGRAAHLDLASGIHRLSAHDVARIAYSDVAWDAANVIGLSCAQQASIGEDLIYPRARFPFTGFTKLRAKGQWLSRGAIPAQTFLVHELLSCSHPFPYDALHYTIHPDTEQARLRKKSNAPDKANSKSSAPAVKGLVQEDGSTKHAARSFSLRRKSQFPDLDYKKTRGALSTAVGPADDGGAAASPKASLGAVGGQATSGKVGAVTLQTGEESRRPEWVEPVLTALAELDHEVNLLTGAEADGWTVAWPPKPPDVDDSTVAVVLVQLCAFALERDDAAHTLVVAAGEDFVDLALFARGTEFLEACLDAVHQRVSAADEGLTTPEPSRTTMADWLRRALDAESQDMTGERFATSPPPMP